ncbi:MAG: hypothetical protein LBQ08_04515 [Holosporaceae bacterium]|jgi:hypothetical protein|nr:hypothetical protein [Holosporaceae bacterium]
MKMIFILFFLTSCSQYETPDLPPLNKKSFSSEEILNKQKELRKKINSLSKEVRLQQYTKCPMLSCYSLGDRVL